MTKLERIIFQTFIGCAVLFLCLTISQYSYKIWRDIRQDIQMYEKVNED